MPTIAERVKKIIVKNLVLKRNRKLLKASFENDLKADSLETVELIMEFEKEFNIIIPMTKLTR